MGYEEKTAKTKPSNLILEDRERLSVSGVEDVISFDEQEIAMRTSRGELTVRGGELRVGRLSVDTGELSIEGLVSEIVYSQERGDGGGFWGRLFG